MVEDHTNKYAQEETVHPKAELDLELITVVTIAALFDDLWYNSDVAFFGARWI